MFASRRSVVSLLLIVCCFSFSMVTTSAEEGQFVSLFNGSDLTGWKGDDHWSVEEGAITGRTTPETLLKYNTFLVWQGGQPADFELRLQYKIVGGNSGVQYRSQVIDEAKLVVSGYQADIDSSPRFTGMNYEEKARRILAERGERVTIDGEGTKHAEQFGDKDALQKKVNDEQWNEYRVIAKGNNLKHYVNGVLMSELTDNQTDKAATSGVIALQLHQGPPMTVQFRDLRLRELK